MREREREIRNKASVASVVKELTSALLTKEDVLALNTFFPHELLKITQRLGCTLCCSHRKEFSTSTCIVATQRTHEVLSGFQSD